jgi:hypothetical protein
VTPDKFAKSCRLAAPGAQDQVAVGGFNHL